MGIDASIYQNIQPVHVDVPSPLDAAQKAMTLSQLGMQQRAMGLQLQNQQALTQAYRNNVDANGNVNQQGVLSDLAKSSPMAAMEYGPKVTAMQKAAAEAQSAHVDAGLKVLDNVTMPKMQYLLTQVPADQRAAVWPGLRQQMIDEGADMSRAPEHYDEGVVKQAYAMGLQTKQHLEGLKTQAEADKTRVETALLPGQKAAELSANLYGSRSPNAELTSQYNADVKGLRVSQVNMQQMLDAYKTKPGPQADASMLLNALRIKNPNVPDVNSLEEMSKSQSVPDQWRQYANKALQGGLDQNTKDNIMRDAMSTYRANTDTLAGVQKRYQARQTQQNVNDPTLTYEPAMQKTATEAAALQDKIGPYVPPTERGGILSGVGNAVSKVLGAGEAPSATASDKPAKPSMSAQDKAAISWANKNFKDPRAKQILKMHGML